jgi:hypothetical protein
MNVRRLIGRARLGVFLRATGHMMLCGGIGVALTSGYMGRLGSLG